MEDETAFYSSSVHVVTYDTLNFTDLAPLLDELNERFVDVEARRTNHHPTMAEGPDVAIALIVLYAGVAGIEFVRKFAGMLAEDSYKAIRQRLLSLRERADEVATERTWSIGVQVGRHPFYSPGPVTDEEFVARLIAAQQTIDSIPPALLTGSDLTGEPYPGWYWRDGQWVATPLLAERLREYRSDR